MFWSSNDDGADNVDPRDRQAVRLSHPPKLSEDLGAGGRADAEPEAITEVEWFAEDALRAEFPVSMRVEGTLQRDLTLVRGNVLLVDHGATYHEVLPAVPAEGHFNPQLAHRGLTHCVPYTSRLATGYVRIHVGPCRTSSSMS